MRTLGFANSFPLDATCGDQFAQKPFRPQTESLVNVFQSGTGFPSGVIHELLCDLDLVPGFVAVIIARQVCDRLTLVWCDPLGELNPAAVVAQGISADRLIILRPHKPADQLWALVECLGCKAVGAVVSRVNRLSFIEARRLQLAAERGGSVGVLLRPKNAASMHYAAATRWLVQPESGNESTQRWRIELIHGQGGQAGQRVLLEACRETNLVRLSSPLVDRPDETPAARFGT